MFGEALDNVRAKNPLIHNITNYVTINDCANILHACGASPIMAEAPEEAAEITAVCDGLNINIGTPNEYKKEAMMIAAVTANELNHPVILDPVGTGASSFRREITANLLDKIKFAVIRGNSSEMKTLAKYCEQGKDPAHNDTIQGKSPTGKRKKQDYLGHITDDKRLNVDVLNSDMVCEINLEAAVSFTENLALRLGSVIAMTGMIDIVTDGETTYCIRNGNPEMQYFTGAGCQLSALTTAFVSANPDDPLWATAAAVSAMGLCGEIAMERMTASDGNSSYRNHIIDAVYNLKSSDLDQGSNYEIR